MGEKLNRIIKSEKDHIFKREIKIERAENGATRSNSTDGASTSALSSSSSTNCAKKSIDEAPVLIFLLFQKAIRSELDVLNSEAISLATGSGGDFKLFSKRFKFLFSIYEHHCNAEDEKEFVRLSLFVGLCAKGWGLFLQQQEFFSLGGYEEVQGRSFLLAAAADREQKAVLLVAIHGGKASLL